MNSRFLTALMVTYVGDSDASPVTPDIAALAQDQADNPTITELFDEFFLEKDVLHPTH